MSHTLVITPCKFSNVIHMHIHVHTSLKQNLFHMHLILQRVQQNAWQRVQTQKDGGIYDVCG